ncbi:MAG: hypothetical protein ABI693_14495 [Bryobacteraceae bacterium]
MRLQFAISRFAWLAAVLFAVTLASAAEVPQDPKQRGSVIGVIDGVPIHEGAVRVGPAAREAEVEALRPRQECLMLNRLLWDAVRDKEVKRRGLFISDEEAEAARRKALESVETRAAFERSRNMMIAEIAALDAINTGTDPEEAYRLHVAQSGMSHSVWESNLAQAVDPSYLPGLKTGIQTMTLDRMVGGVDRYKGSNALRKRLARIIDAELAAGDARFAAGLATNPQGPGNPDYDYMDNRRLAWWTERTRKMDVIIYDQRLAKQCPISDGQVRLDAIPK